jgi:hypothetical protein
MAGIMAVLGGLAAWGCASAGQGTCIAGYECPCEDGKTGRQICGSEPSCDCSPAPQPDLMMMTTTENPDVVCGDGYCNAPETCDESQLGDVCAEDCCRCGDDRCSGEVGENCVRCPEDCGACTATCENGRCEGGEDPTVCAGDCMAIAGCRQACEHDSDCPQPWTICNLRGGNVCVGIDCYECSVSGRTCLQDPNTCVLLNCVEFAGETSSASGGSATGSTGP